MSLIQKQGQQKEDVYLNFVNSIKSDVTKKIYAYNLRLFMEFCDIDKFEDLIGRQNQIITYLMSLREKKLSYNSRLVGVLILDKKYPTPLGLVFRTTV
jgi:hypothetical protein